MIGLSGTPSRVVLIDVAGSRAAEELSEFFMRPHYDLDAVLSADDRKWLPLLMHQEGAVRN